MQTLRMIRLKRAWSLSIALRSLGDIGNLGKLHRLMLVRTAKKSANTENDVDCEKCKQIIEYLFSPLRTPDEMKKIQEIILSDIKKLQEVMDANEKQNVEYEPCKSECDRCNQIIAAIFGENNPVDSEESKTKAPITDVEKLLSTTAKQTEEQLVQKVETIDEPPVVEAETPKITGFITPPRVLGHEEPDTNRSVGFESNTSNIESNNMRHQFERMVRRLENSEILRNVSPIQGGVLNCASSCSEQDGKSGDSSVNKHGNLDSIAERLLNTPNCDIDARLIEEMKRLGVLRDNSDKNTSNNFSAYKKPGNPSEKNEIELEAQELNEDQSNCPSNYNPKLKSQVQQFQGPNDAAKLRAEGIRFVEQKPPNEGKFINIHENNEERQPPYDPNRLFADRKMYYFNSLKEKETKNVYKANERVTSFSECPWLDTDQVYFDNLVKDRFKLPEEISKEKVSQKLLTSEYQELPLCQVLPTSQQETHSNAQEQKVPETLNINASDVKEPIATNTENFGHKADELIQKQNESQPLNEVTPEKITQRLYISQYSIQENQNVSTAKDTISPCDKENPVSDSKNDDCKLCNVHEDIAITDADYPKEKPVYQIPYENAQILFSQENPKEESHIEDHITSETVQIFKQEYLKKETHEENVPEYLVDVDPPIYKQCNSIPSVDYPTEDKNKLPSNVGSYDKRNITTFTDLHSHKPVTDAQQTLSLVETQKFYPEPQMYFYPCPQMLQYYSTYVPYYRQNGPFSGNLTIEQNEWPPSDERHPQNYYDGGATYYNSEDNQYSHLEDQLDNECMYAQSSSMYRPAEQGIYTPTQYSHLEDHTDDEHYVDAQSRSTPEQLQNQNLKLYLHLEDQIPDDEYIDAQSRLTSRPVEQLHEAHDPTSQPSEYRNPSVFLYQPPTIWSNQYSQSQSNTPPFYQNWFEQNESRTAREMNENSIPWIRNPKYSWMEHERYSQVPSQQPLSRYEGEEAEGSQPEYFNSDQNKRSKSLDLNNMYYSDPFTDVHQTTDSEHDADYQNVFDKHQNVKTRSLDQLQGALYTAANYKKLNDQELFSFPHQQDPWIFEDPLYQTPQLTEAYTFYPPLDSKRPYFSNERMDFNASINSMPDDEKGTNESLQDRQDLSMKQDPFDMQPSMDKMQANIFQITDQIFDPNNPNHRWIADQNQPPEYYQPGYVYYASTPKQQNIQIEPYAVAGTVATQVSKTKSRANRRAPMSRAKVQKQEIQTKAQDDDKDSSYAPPSASMDSFLPSEIQQGSTPTELNQSPSNFDCLPLSEALRRIRRRNRQEHIAKWEQLEPVTGKCGKPRPPCPPPRPMCPQPSPPKAKPCPGPPPPCPRPCKPRCPSPCTPTKPPCPPPPLCKFTSVPLADTLYHILTLLWDFGMTGLCTVSKNWLTPSDAKETLIRDVRDQLQTEELLTTYGSGIGESFWKMETLILARDFEPWVPIPSWPIQIKKEKKKIVCPKDGCKKRPPPRHGDPCELPCYPGNPCIGFPNQHKKN